MTTPPTIEEVYDKYNGKIRAVCWSVFKSEDDVEDMVQVVYMHLIQKIHSFRGESAFTTWLHRFTLNQCLMELRKRYFKNRKKEVTFETDDDMEFTLESMEAPKENLDLSMDLLTVIKQLPKGYRDVLLLRNFAGLEHQEVAEVLNVSVGTVKSQDFKAREKAKKLFLTRANPKVAVRPLDVPGVPLSLVRPGYHYHKPKYKFGKNPDGLQRWMCVECGMIYTSATNRILKTNMRPKAMSRTIDKKMSKKISSKGLHLKNNFV